MTNEEFFTIEMKLDQVMQNPKSKGNQILADFKKVMEEVRRLKGVLDRASESLKKSHAMWSDLIETNTIIQEGRNG